MTKNEAMLVSDLTEALRTIAQAVIPTFQARIGPRVEYEPMVKLETVEAIRQIARDVLSL